MSVHIKELANYVDAAANLAALVESDLLNNDGILTKETILALNEFVFAQHAIADVTNALQKEIIKLN